MNVYLSSPGNQMHADYLSGMPVLLSYATYRPWIASYEPSFGRTLLDSGAYSEFSSGVKVDLAAYMDWAAARYESADAVAGLDDISGDWRRSMANYEAYPQGFPTYHETDPAGLLKELVAMAKERGGWLGIGLVPPRNRKGMWLRETLEQIPPGIHVHGWALREYTHLRRIDSVDSTNWFRDAWEYSNRMPFLTPAEALELVIKRYQRWRRSYLTEEDTLFGKVGVIPYGTPPDPAGKG